MLRTPTNAPRYSALRADLKPVTGAMLDQIIRLLGVSGTLFAECLWISAHSINAATRRGDHAVKFAGPALIIIETLSDLPPEKIRAIGQALRVAVARDGPLLAYRVLIDAALERLQTEPTDAALAATHLARHGRASRLAP